MIPLLDFGLPRFLPSSTSALLHFQFVPLHTQRRNYMTTNKTYSGHGLWDIQHVTWSHLFQRQQLVHRFLPSWYSRLNDFEPSAWHQWVHRFSPLHATLSMFEKLHWEISSSFGSFLSWPQLLSLSSLESITCKIIGITTLTFLKSRLNLSFPLINFIIIMMMIDPEREQGMKGSDTNLVR